MATNIIRYIDGQAPRWGVVRDGRVAPIPGEYATTRAFILEGVPRIPEAGDSTVALADVVLAPPITPDQQFICQAINYYSHMKESGFDPAANPFNIFFRKASSCLAPANTDVVRPVHVQCLDYEVEIGLVFARDVSGPETVTVTSLHEYVAALTIVNDVSARDVQLPEMQFYKGKSYRTFGPVGPYLTLVDAAELARFGELVLRLSVNGEVRQDSPASDMIHKPVPTLNELFALQDVRAGDLLATGTPGGCALRSPGKLASVVAGLVSPKRRKALIQGTAARNPRYLKPGDRMETSIRTPDGAIDFGVQRNRVVGPSS